MRKGNGRVLTEKDMEGSLHKLCYMSEFDKLVEVCRVAIELDKQEEQNNVRIFDSRCSVDKSWEKRYASTHQDCEKTPLFSSRTCRISAEELFKGGRMKSRGETSSSSWYYECGNVRRSCSDHDDHVVKENGLGNKRDSEDEDFEYCDQLVKEKVLGNKGDSEDEDFEYCDQLVKEKVLGKKRNFYDSEDEDFEYSEKKEKKARKNVKARNKVVETAPLPVEFADEIKRLGGNDVRLLIQKYISITDLKKDQNRLSISNNQVREEAKDFLTEAELKYLDKRIAGKGIVSMQVPLLEPNLNRSYIDFKKWPMKTSFWYVLCGSWFVMQKRNHLQAHTDLQVWSFRVNGELNLALVKVPQN